MKPAPSTQECILVVEDNPDLRATMAMVLGGEGYAVACAANGQEALRYLHECPPPCLILLDLMMPVMSGWEFRERQRQEPALASIPIVVVSAVANHREKIAAMDAVDQLLKPVDPTVLIAKVNQYCMREGAAPPMGPT